MHILVHPHMHAFIARIYAYIKLHAYITYILTCMHEYIASMHACMKHMCKHAHIHTCTQTHTHMHPPPCVNTHRRFGGPGCCNDALYFYVCFVNLVYRNIESLKKRKSCRKNLKETMDGTTCNRILQEMLQIRGNNFF